MIRVIKQTGSLELTNWVTTFADWAGAIKFGKRLMYDEDCEVVLQCGDGTCDNSTLLITGTPVHN